MKLLALLLLLVASAQAASKVAITTGNFTTAGTWATASAAAENLSHATTTTISTGNTDSSTFVLLATAVQQYCVEMASRLITTGTMTVHLRDSTAGTNVLSVTVNMSDLPANPSWICFDPGSSTTPGGVDAYLIRVTCSNANCATLYVSAGTNLAREVVTTTTGAPAAADVPLITTGFHTGAGTSTSVLVTMNDTSGNSYGSTTPPASVIIGDIGAWTNATSASTNYTFKHKGIFNVYSGGQLSIGTSGTRVPSTSTATYTADVASNVDSGWVFSAGSIVNSYGVAKTRWTTLTADVAAAATVIPVASTTGWAVGDTLVFSSTTRTGSQSETKVILTVDSATQVTLTAGLTNAHTGTSAFIRGEVGNLTSNVKFTGTSASLQGYIQAISTSTVNMAGVEFNNLGSNTANKRGIDIQTTTGTFNVDNSSAHNFTVSGSAGFYFNQSASQLTTGTVSITNNATYSIDNWHVNCGAATTNTTYVVSGNLGILNNIGGNNGIFQSVDVGGTWTNNVAASALQYGHAIFETNATTGTISGNSSHSNGNAGFLLNAAMSGTFGVGFVWRNNSHGILSATAFGAGSGTPAPFVVSGGTFTGNTGDGLNVQIANTNLVVDNCTFSGDSTFSTATGINFVNGNAAYKARIINSTFGVATGVRVAHTTGDIGFGAGNLVEVDASWSTFASTTVVAAITSAFAGSYVGITGFGQSATANNLYTPTGNATADTSIFRTASPSQRLTPSNANAKLYQRSIYIPIASGTSTATLSVWVRKSVVGDPSGANYNGATPRLIVQANPAAGTNYNSDVVCASGGGSGSFAQLTCTLPATTNAAMLVAYVDCDGTAGWINVSDVAVTTTAPGLGNPTYFDRGFMSVTSGQSGTLGGGGSFTFAQ